MRSAVVIRFRCGRDTGDASGSCLGNGECAMLASIYLLLLQGCAARSICLKLVLEAVMLWRSADIETMIMILIILHSDDLVNLLIRGTFKDTAHPARTGEVCG